MRQMLACFCTLVHKGAMLGGAAGVQKRRRYSAFAPYGLPACSSIALKLCGLPVACLLGSSTGTHGVLPVRVLGWTALKPLLSKWRSTSVALSAPATELAGYRSFALSEAKRLDCHAPKQYGCRWPACLALAPCCPCRCKALEQQAVERSGVAGCGGDEAMRLPLACCGALVLKCAMLGGAAGVQKRRRYSAFAPVCWPACLALAICCPCRCEALEQKAAERSGVAYCERR